MFYRIDHSGFVDKHGAARPANVFHARGAGNAELHVLQLAHAGAVDATMTEITESDYREVCRKALATIKGVA